MEFHEFLDLVRTAQIKYPSWRRGQAVFNVLEAVRPDLTPKIRGTLIDPFYQDDATKACLEFVAKEW